MPRGNRDILLPERDRFRLNLRQRVPRLEIRVPRISWPRRRPPQRPDPRTITAADILRVFEYVSIEWSCRSHACLPLIDALGGRMASLQGEERLAIQSRLAGILAADRPARFATALLLATRIPVPQARMALLDMLTQPALARWRPHGPSGEGQGRAGDCAPSSPMDLRPAVVAALGRLQDASLIPVFHRLLGKCSSSHGGQTPLVTAVQWSLMNLAPGAAGEPVPLELLLA